MNVNIKTNFSKEELIKKFAENTTHHSPVLNSGHIQKTKTDKKLCGEIRENGFFVWMTLNKKAVFVPIVKGEFEDKNIKIKIELPLHNKYMLIFWYVSVGLYCLFNSAYIPFSYNKFLYLVNIVSGVAVLFASAFFTKRIFKKRAAETINIIEKITSK